MSSVAPSTPSSALVGERQQPQYPSSSSPARQDASSTTNTPSLTESAPSAISDPSSAEKHPKGKRKRTATKDKLILEEAYSLNPKPDKQARLDIVNRVSLNEKEVQIWFQNRRQNDRRKSRPLSPQELAALRFGGLHNISSDPITSQSILAEPDKSFLSSDADIPQANPDHIPTSPHAPTSPLYARSNIEGIHATPRYTTQSTNATNQSHITPPQRQVFSSSQEDSSLPCQTSAASSVGYLANRWNLGNSSFSSSSPLSRDGSFKFELLPSSSCSSSSKTTQSHVRLSLSIDGKAELVPNDASSPIRETPARPSSTLPSLPQVRQKGLQRSHSALPAITLPPISTLTSSLPPRLIRGRSRDVHAWELCADADTRDELTTQAEHESNGSAIAAISLLRSTSGILQPIGAKRNATSSKLTQPRQAKKPKLSRTGSSMARLETTCECHESPLKPQSGKGNVSLLISPTDSDKENWSPIGAGNPQNGHQQLPPVSPLKVQNARRQGRALQDHKSSPFLSNRANTAPSVSQLLAKGEVEIFRDSDSRPESSREDEVSKFMRGEVSPSKKGDMDCIAGLLSLSQGAWR